MATAYCVVVAIGFLDTEYNVTEGMVITVCVELRDGYLERNTTVILSTMDATASCNHACYIIIAVTNLFSPGL